MPESITIAAAQHGVVREWPRRILLLEGACLFGSSIWAYSRLNRSWWSFAGLMLVPDLAMAGYAANTRVGAAIYNIFHSETPPILMLCTGVARSHTPSIAMALIWLAHIGMDRMLGFGLKYETGFQHTHLGNAGMSK